MDSRNAADPDCFGRASLISDLRHRFESSPPGSCLALTGCEGVGKTSIARQYARRFEAAYPGGVVWLSAFGCEVRRFSASEIEALRQSEIASVARRFGVDADALGSPVAALQTLFWSLQERGLDFLWVVDDFPEGADGELESWLAPAPGHNLITARRPGWQRVVSLEVKPLTPAQGESLMTQMARIERLRPAEARSMVEQLGGWPFALVLARAILRAGNSSSELASQIDRVAAGRHPLAAQLGETMPKSQAESTVALISLALGRLSASGRDLLLLASLMAPLAIPSQLMASVYAAIGEPDQAAARHAAGAAIFEACESGLADGAADEFTAHPLVLRFIALDPEYAARREALRAPLLERLLFDLQNDAASGHAERIALHGWFAATEGADAASALLLAAVGCYRYRRGEHLAAACAYRRALATLTRIRGERHHETITAIGNLAGCLRQLGQFDEALQLAQRGFDLCRSTLGERHPDTLTAMGNLAATLFLQGDYDSARQLQQQAAQAFEAGLGIENPATLSTLGNLALTCKAQGDLAAAAKLQQRVLQFRSRVLGEQHQATIDSISNLALTLYSAGERDRAVQLARRALELASRSLGEAHPHTLAAINSLAWMLERKGEAGEALQLIERELDARRALQGARHPQVSMIAWKLYELLCSAGKNREADALLRRHLAWLATAEPASLVGDQASIRAHVVSILAQESTGRPPVAAVANPAVFKQ